MKICTNCGHKNPDDIHICLNCASTLRQSCPSCGSEVPFGYKFCGQCGARIPQICPSCGATASEEAQFCDKCGASLEAKKADQEAIISPRDHTSRRERLLKDLRARMPSSLSKKIIIEAPEMVGQRREVTVVFVDIANFTSLTQLLDSEGVFLLVDEMMQILADVIYTYEGTIDKFTGDGLVALFGIPINHENDPERAVRAALEMLSVVEPLRARLKAKNEINLNLRVGINTGLVIVGSLGSMQHMEYTVIGDTVNLASRLESAAEPGSILVSFSTYQRSRPIFNYQALPPMHIKGLSNLVKAFRPLGVRLKPGQVRGLPGLQVPMVGRGKDFQCLSEALAQVREGGTSQVVLCSGEAGIGKTRLVAEFRNALANQSVNSYQGTCASYMRVTPYRVVADIIRSMIHVSEMDAEEIQREALHQHLIQFGEGDEEISPYLLHVLGFTQSDPLLEVRLKLLDPTMLQRQTHSALRTFFVSQAQLSPTAMIFDDLHWVDPSSRDFLEYFIQSIDDIPILLVLISRDYKEHSLARSLETVARRRARKPVEVHLQPLSVDDSRLLVDQLIQEKTSLASNLKLSIAQRAGGNPYYTEEIVRTLMEGGGLTLEDDAWHVTQQASELIQEVPGTLRDIILARFDCLSERLRHTLQMAAVLGNSFAISLLQTLSGEDIEDLFPDLEELVRRDFLISTQLGIEDGYIFKHSLLLETIYHTMLRRDLGEYHLRVAQAIEAGVHWLPAEQNEVLAHHYAESNNPTKAIPYLLISAEKASQRFASETVVQHYRRALNLMEKAPELPLDEYNQARIGLGQALKYLGEFDEALQVLQGAVDSLMEEEISPSELEQKKLTTLLEGLRELADIRAREGALEIAVETLQVGLNMMGESGREMFPIQWRRLVDRLAWVLFRQGKLEEAFNLADLALLDANTWEMDDPITLASISNTLGGIYWHRSRFAEAIDSVERSLRIYKDLNYAWGMAIAYTNLGVLHYSMGEWPQAVANLEQADTLRHEYGYTPERPINLKNLGEVLIVMGDHARAREKLHMGRDISYRLGMNLSAAYAEIGLCRLAIIEKKIESARTHLQAAKRLLVNLESEMDDRTIQTLFLEALIEAEQGDLEAGLKAAQKAYQIADQAGFVAEKTETLRVLGILNTRLGAFEEAQKYLQSSIDYAQSQKDRYRQAQALLELGLMYIDWQQSKKMRSEDCFELARDALTEAIDHFETLGAKHDLAQSQMARDKIPVHETLTFQISDPAQIQTQVVQLRASLGMPEGEWYQAVILHIKTKAQQDTDDEFIFETIAILMPSILEIIRENDGEIIRHRDGLTAVFGAPVAQENDPERAVDTAMQVVNFYQELYRQTKVPLTLRLGISMGKIVAGSIPHGEDREYIVAGEPAQEAELLAEAAPPTRVWVSESVRNATSFRFQYASITSNLTNHLPGISIFQLEGIREQIGPVRGLIGLKAPFIGRHGELATMKAISRNLDRNLGGLIWIEGDPGIGKSRLMREFGTEILTDEMYVLQGSCSPRRVDFAFSLFSDLLSKTFDLQSSFSTEHIYAQIDQKLASWPTELSVVRPFLQLLTGVRPEGKQGSRLDDLEPEQLRRQVFVAFRKVISTLASQKPLVLLLDDLQWIDPISADLLLFITHLIISHPVLILATRRSAEPSSSEETLSRIRRMHPEHVIHISVQPLTNDESRLLLREFLTSANLAEAVHNLIVQQSGGNPYFIEEFVRMLVEQDYLRLNRGVLEVNQAFEIDDLTIPASLETLIRARVDSLPNQTRKLLQVAAVIGQSFSNDLLERVSGQERIETQLELLQSRGMLTPTTEKDRWEFSHTLIENIVYNSVLKAQRRILHSRTAKVLEAQWQGNEAEHSEDLAYHFGRAEEHEKALYYHVLAGERAAARHANEAALGYFEEAAELLNLLPGTSDDIRWRIATGLGEVCMFVGNFEASIAALQSELERMEVSSLTPEQRAGLNRILGQTYLKKGNRQDAIAYFDRALQVLGPLDLPQAQTEASLTLERLGWSYFMQADLERAREVGLQALSFAQKAKSLRAQAKVENLLGGISYRQGELAQAVLHTQKAKDHWEQMGFGLGVASSLNNLGILEVAAGNWNEALEYFQNSLELRQEMGDVEGVAITHNNLGTLAREQGDMQRAESHFRNCLAVAKPFQLPWHTANSTMGVAQALLYQNSIEEAQEMLQEGIKLAQEIEARDLTSEMERTQAEIQIAQGDFEKAYQTAQRAAKLAADIGNRLMEAGAWRVAANSLLQAGKSEEALQALDRAWLALSEVDDEVETGRMHAQARVIHLALEDIEKAEWHYQTALEIFSRLGAARDLARLEAS